MRVVLAVLMCCLGMQPVVAENRFFVQQGNWSIANFEGLCIASSRSFAETNMSPVATVRFIMLPETREVFLETYYWPGAIEKGQATTLRFGKDVEVPATATSDYSVKTDRPFSREELKFLENEHLLGVKAADVSWPIGVEATGLGWAFYYLRDCAHIVRAD